MKPLTSTNDGNEELREKQREILKQIEKEIMDNVDDGSTKVCNSSSPEKFKNFVSVSLNANEDDESSRCNQQNSMLWRNINEKYGFNRYCLWLIMALIALCCAGMCASIGGAIYIRYFRQNSVKTLSPNSTLLAGNKRLSSASTVPSQASIRPEIFRVNIKINSAEEKASTNLADSLSTISSTMDPFEETLFKEMFKRPNDGEDLDTHMHSGSSIESEFTAVNGEGDLQKPPAITDLINFVKRLLNIPDLSVQTTTEKI